MKNDQFAAIAATGIGGRSDLLHEPQPKPFPNRTTRLKKGGTPKRVTPKMSTAEELKAALQAEKERYAPYLRDLAPSVSEYQVVKPLNEFDYRLETEHDRKDFLSLFAGKGKWEKVTLPHYGAPVGNAVAYYRTVFTVEEKANKRYILSFGGVDYKTTVHINGHLAGTHEGFFSPFEVELTPYVRFGEENILLIRVENDFIYMGNKTQDGRVYEGDKLYAATGIGYDDPALGWHHCPPGMGIYANVTLSVREQIHLTDLFVRPMPEESKAEIWAEVDCATYESQEISFEIGVYGKNFTCEPLMFTYRPTTERTVGMGDSLTEASAKQNGTLGAEIPLLAKKGKNIFRIPVEMPDFTWWTPDAPCLYEAQVTLFSGKVPQSGMVQQFGMRTFRQDTESEKKGMFYLNGDPIRLRGANTMGFEQLDVMRGDMDQLVEDILLAKICHMNFLRLTQRPVQDEVYSYCDRLGMLTQTDLPLFGCMRRNKFAEGVRQAEEMERIVRRHPSNILVTYINEPFPNANNEPHRHLVRSELEDFFTACDKAVHLQNPDRVIKYVDGDYDPPSKTMPDNHCYPLWYNGHGIDIGKLHKGYWLPVAEGWYYGCGEFGIEGLDPENVMREDYPAEWMAGEEQDWSPARIVNAQTAAFHYMFYDTKHSVKDWVEASQTHQAEGLRLMTEAFRRNPDMVSFAVHLFIDAWPSGWMKTIMDHRRQPKKAYFAYRNALEPVLVSLRSDRFTYFDNETASIECFLANDTKEAVSGEVFYELYQGRSLIASGSSHAECPACDAAGLERVQFAFPRVVKRTAFTLRTHFGNTFNDLALTVFPYEEVKTGEVILAGQDIEKAVQEAQNGKTVLLEMLPAGEYTVGKCRITVKNAGMLPMHFVSRNTDHPLVEGFLEKDFAYWYDSKENMLTPILSTTFTGEGVIPVLTSGNMNEEGEWQTQLACGEIPVGEGKIILCQVDVRTENPVARIFYNRIMEE